MVQFRVFVASAAAALTLSVAPAARANHEGAVYATVFLTPLGHLTLLPGYLSAGYYASEDRKPMPLPWMIANGGTSLLAGSAGVFTMGLAFKDGVEAKWVAIGGTAGASVLIGSAIVFTASLLQGARPSGQSSGSVDSALRSLVVLPTGGVTPNGASTAGLSIAGRF